MSTWLVTGGAGYIGGHVTHALRAGGMDVVVLDDLSSGLPSRIPDDVPLIVASILDTAVVLRTLAEYDVDGVVHVAAKKSVEESIQLPLVYWRQNVTGVQSVLTAMADAGVERMVFSSSAAVWGTPSTERVTEETLPAPVSPYGETKLVGEWLIRDVARVSPLRWVALRYFNVAGTAGPALADTGVTNLIPLVFRALTEGRPPQIFGADYPTRDGTCVRDYIHVADLADAHVAAARTLSARPVGEVLNIGRGEGVTVAEVLDVVRRVVGRDFCPQVVARRDGDPAGYYADPAKAEGLLGWRATRSLEEIVRSAWEAWPDRLTPP